MKLKQCTRCLLEKSLDEFNWRNKKKNQRASHCKECTSRHDSWRYQHGNRGKTIKASKSRLRKRNLDFFIKWLDGRVCCDCGESDPIVLVPDHQHDKHCNVSMLIHAGNSIERIVAELEKCEIVCCNCHQRRTAKQQGWYRLGV